MLARRRHVRHGSGTVSCVVDEHPRFHLDALRWFATATRLAGIAAPDLTVNVVGRQDSEVLAYLQERGVHLNSVEPFDASSPHCNKIAGAIALVEQRRLGPGGHGPAVLTDSDVVICEDPRALRVADDCVASKPVDMPNPPLDVLERVFAAAGVELPPVVGLDADAAWSSVEGNGNGGLYVVGAGALGPFSLAWQRWARWLLDRSSLLGGSFYFADQVAAALAIASEPITWQRLPLRWNTPTHMVELTAAETEPPAVIHYHQELEASGLLALCGVAVVDERIEAANEAIASVFEEASPQATLAAWR